MQKFIVRVESEEKRFRINGGRVLCVERGA